MNYEYYGIRTQDVPFEAVGDTMTHTSVVWVDGNETEEELSGVCALLFRECDDLDALASRSRKIYGYGKEKYTAIIASNSAEYGEDADEIILIDPVVIRIL